MQLEALLDLIVGVSDANQLMPRGFSILGDCLKHGIKTVTLKTYIFNCIAASYENGEIQLDPKIDRKRIAAQIQKRNGVDIKPEEVFLWMFFHELFHHLRLEIRHDEWGAENYARKRFLEWKRTHK